MERLQRSSPGGSGVAPEAERWIVEGRITVNGTVVNKLALKPILQRQYQIDGKRVKAAAAPLYYALHKPPG